MEYYALIIGAASGLELAYAKWFAEKGHNLIMTGRGKEMIGGRAQGIEDKYACKVIVILVDSASKDGMRKLFASLEDREVHVPVNNAGLDSRISFSDTDIDGLKRLIYLQTTAVARIAHHVLKGVKERNRGIIINISSDGAFAVVPDNVTYAASKRFIATLAKGFHMELMGTEIRVQTVYPGFVDTDLHEDSGMYTGKTRKGVFEFWQPEDVVGEATKELEKGKVICIPDKVGKPMKVMAEYIPKRIYYRFTNDFVNKNIRKN